MSVSRRCAMSTTMTYNRCTYLLTTYTCSCPRIRSTRRVRLYERSRASRRGRCGNSTDRFWRATCGVVDSEKSRTTLGRQAQCRPRQLNSILSERNTFSGTYGLHPRGQAPRHSACFFCGYRCSPSLLQYPCQKTVHETYRHWNTSDSSSDREVFCSGSIPISRSTSSLGDPPAP